MSNQFAAGGYSLILPSDQRAAPMRVLAGVGIGSAMDPLHIKLPQLQVAVQIRDVAEARHFYREVLGCLEVLANGEERLDFSLNGQSIICHLNPKLGRQGRVPLDYRLMDGKYLPISRCGAVLEWKEWKALAGRLRQHGVKFVIEPLRLEGIPGEQVTLSLLDPSGNALEFRSFRNIAEQGSPRELRGIIGKRTLWFALAALIALLWILMQGRLLTNDGLDGDVHPVSMHVPPCAASGRSCVP